MYTWNIKVVGRGVVMGASLLLVSCGGDSSEDGSVDPVEQNSQDGDSNASLIVPPDVLPALNSDAAETGLQGCLNRPLYYNGPHFVSTSYEVTVTGFYNSSSHTEQIDYIYTVTDVNAEGVAQVSVETTVATSNSTGGTFTRPYTLNGYTVAAVDDSVPVLSFDLEAGESVTQTLSTQATGSVGRTHTYTYVGREMLTINGQQFEACRIDTEVRDESQLPQFRFLTDLSEWYAVGSGLKLKTEGVSEPDSEEDRTVAVRVLTFGSINSESVFQ